MKTTLTALVILSCGICLAKPSMHVRKLGSATKYAESAGASTVTGTVPATYYIDGKIVEEKSEETLAGTMTTFKASFKTSQAYQFSISIAEEKDLEQEWTLNVITILKHKSNSGGYAYTKTASFKLKFYHTGANEGSLRLVYMTPQYFGEPTDPTRPWVINGIAAELLDSDGKVMRAWSNASFGMKFASGLAPFFKNLPRTMHATPIPSGVFGLIALKNENVTIESLGDKKL